MAKLLKSTKASTEDMAFTNCAFVSKNDFNASLVRHVEVKTGPAHRYIFTIKNDSSVSTGRIAFSMYQRRWAQISLEQDLQVSPINFDPTSQCISTITLEVDFHNKKQASADPCDTDVMAREFSMQFPQQAFSRGQELAFKFGDKKALYLLVKDIEAVNLTEALKADAKTQSHQIQCGLLLPNSTVIFNKCETSNIILTGKSKGKMAYRSIMNPDWSFEKMGIGGLDKEFSAIFRRSFGSRVFPPEFIDQLGMKHVRGILLYGPPGTGKTLIARQIGKMLNAREPKVINGPEILDKYVGESENNIRKLFADAEEEFKRVGSNSGLHIIIFDEIDAICKQRGSVAGSTAVHDTVVNQLLSKLDGVDQLNNILVIGMTNRKDMIDEALLRPGRFEVQMEIGLADEAGRLQILNIHTARMREFKKMSNDVDLKELAALTKNFSGAEIEGLVRAAQSSAMNRLVKAASKVEIDPDAIEKLLICREDFIYALNNDIKPAFGFSSDQLEKFLRGNILNWGDPVRQVLDQGDLLIEQAQSSERGGLVAVLLHGPANSGKTALAAAIAKSSNFPFIKVVSPAEMVAYTENAKCLKIKKAFDDAYKSPLSIVLLDDLERLIEYGSIGPRYSNAVLQTLLTLLKQPPPLNKKLLILATTSQRAVMEELEMLTVFQSLLFVPPISRGQEIVAVLEELDVFTGSQLATLQRKLDGKACRIGIKKLLGLSGLARQYDDVSKVNGFILKMQEEGCLED